MSTISLRLTEDEFQLVKAYSKANGLALSAFIRDTVLDKIESDLCLDEERIIRARERIQTEQAYDHTEVWQRLGV